MIGMVWELLEMVGILVGFLTGNTNLMILCGCMLIYIAIKNLEE